MPTLVTFAVASRVIVDQQANISLIDLLQGLQVASPVPNAPRPPRNFVVPKEWAIFSFWKPEEGDWDGQTFTVVARVLWPDGTQFNRTEQIFRFQPRKKHFAVVNVMGFPAGQEGNVKVDLWLERDSHPVSETSTWLVEVVHHFSSATN